MAKQDIMQFKRGDDLTQYFSIPADTWMSGGTLFFAAKTQPDNDLTDARAVINKSFNDSYVSDEIIDDISYKTYTLPFAPSDITGISFANGETQLAFNGEFQIVASDGKVSSFPGDDTYIQVIIYADIKRAII